MTDTHRICLRYQAPVYPTSADPTAGETAAGDRARAQGAYATLVSLFLLLLVFFVLLVSVSRVEAEKLAAVAASLDRALAGLPSRLGWTIAAPLPQASDIDDPDRTAPAIVLRDVAALVTGFAPAAKLPEPAAAEPTAAAPTDDPAADNAQPNGAVVALATDPLVQFDGSPGIWFDADDSLSRAGRGLALRLAVILQRRPDAAHAYHLRLTYHVPDGDAPSAAPAHRSAERRIAALAGALFTAGCPAPAITVAVEPIAAASASMRYRLSLDRAETAGNED